MKRYVLTICIIAASVMSADAHIVIPDSVSPQKLMKAAYRYKYGINTDVDTRKAAYIYKHLARKGNKAAMRELGKMYLSGDGVRMNKRSAFRLLNRAAAAGDTKAMCHLAGMYRSGNGVKLDNRKAFACYNEAARRGNSQGYYGAGYMLYKGYGVKQDYKMAEQYLKRGSEKKHPGCDFLLGTYYAGDISGTPDYEKAKTYFGKAVKNGHGWTVDLTKLGTLDSIRNRNATRGKMSAGLKWKNKLTQVHDDAETALETVCIDSLDGRWTGKLYTYDWSNNIVLNEEDITFEFTKDGAFSNIKLLQDEKTVSTFAPDLDGDGILTAMRKPDNYRDFRWIVTKAKFGMSEDGRLCARLVRSDIEKKELKKPAFVVLQREGTDKCDISSFRILDVSPSPLTGSLFNVRMMSDVSCTVDISIYNTIGVKMVDCGRYSVDVGCNDIPLEAILPRGKYVLYFTSEKGKVTKNIIHL